MDFGNSDNTGVFRQYTSSKASFRKYKNLFFENRTGKVLWETKAEKRIRKKARNKPTKSRAKKTKRRLINSLLKSLNESIK
ncbi:MAG: hypothetical protein ACI8ZB_000779 [Desulforhopalus sp.]